MTIQNQAKKWAERRAGERKAVIAFSDVHDAYQAGFVLALRMLRTGAAYRHWSTVQMDGDAPTYWANWLETESEEE